VALKDETFAVWITGLPASGKSTIAAALKARLAAQGVEVTVLESDELRKVFANQHGYGVEDRDSFYRQMAYMGGILLEHGVPVIFDATANRRVFRDRVRAEVPRFLEVYLDVPLATCMQRDPKGIYRSAANGDASNVPGLQEPYEPPQAPDLVVHGANPDSDARQIVEKLIEKGFLK